MTNNNNDSKSLLRIFLDFADFTEQSSKQNMPDVFSTLAWLLL